jgi:DNA-binding transcriptional ArsR family regulator
MRLMDALELLLHPVRLRIVHGLAGGEVRTTADLAARMPGVSMATLYRQVALLVDGGVIEVAGERRVRGAVERSYRLSAGRPAVSAERVAAMSLEDHRAAFVAAAAALVAEFETYVDGVGADPATDSVGYRQITVWLDEGEVEGFVREMTDRIEALKANTPGAGRRLYLLSPVFFPMAHHDRGPR